MKKSIQKTAYFTSINAYKQKGITLMELMIALILSSIVIAAILINVATVGRTSIVQSNQSDMIENGQFALNILTTHIRNAGYSEQLDVPSPLEDRTDRFGDSYLLGCSENAVNLARAADIKDWGAECTGSAGGNQAIAVRYQAAQLDEVPSLTTGKTSIGMRTCTGLNATDFVTVDGKKNYIVDNRFYINNRALTCWGNTGGSGLVMKLVDNIEHMEFLYGVSERIVKSSFEVLAGENSHYMTAAQINSAYSSEPNKGWDRVTSVRICLIVRSKNPVPTVVQPYINCAGASTTVTDGYFRKAMLTTVEVANMGIGLSRN